MKRKKQLLGIAGIIGSAFLAGGITVYGAAELQKTETDGMIQNVQAQNETPKARSGQAINLKTDNTKKQVSDQEEKNEKNEEAVFWEFGQEGTLLLTNECTESAAYEVDKTDMFKPYEEFGLVYNADTDELLYNGKKVRLFEDYYPVDGENKEMMAGVDFYDENGVTDVFAARDLENIVRNEDGSYDPSGKLTGLRESTREEFESRFISDIGKNFQPVTACEGGFVSIEEMEKIAKEYEPFGVTYDGGNDQWYFKGEKVYHFLDVLRSNGESFNGGKFEGVMRTFGSNDGTVKICTVRDYDDVDEFGYGKLVDVVVNE